VCPRLKIVAKPVSTTAIFYDITDSGRQRLRLATAGLDYCKCHDLGRRQDSVVLPSTSRPSGTVYQQLCAHQTILWHRSSTNSRCIFCLSSDSYCARSSTGADLTIQRLWRQVGLTLLTYCCSPQSAHLWSSDHRRVVLYVIYRGRLLSAGPAGTQPGHRRDTAGSRPVSASLTPATYINALYHARRFCRRRLALQILRIICLARVLFWVTAIVCAVHCSIVTVSANCLSQTAGTVQTPDRLRGLFDYFRICHIGFFLFSSPRRQRRVFFRRVCYDVTMFDEFN